MSRGPISFAPKSLFLAILLALIPAVSNASEFAHPWDDADNALVLDPFQGNALTWELLQTDKRLTGIIHKASQGLGRDAQYTARRMKAKSLNYLWGSYHLLTTADVPAQIDNYLAIAGTDVSEAHALDIECLSTFDDCQSKAFKVSFNQIESAIRFYKTRTGKLPLLYVNNAVAQSLARRWRNSNEFGKVPLWYARFKRSIDGVFPLGPWKTYTLWQFSSEINCDKSRCPYRVPGTDPDIDVNVYFGAPARLRQNWPLDH